jgi:multicomponent Na+:H+ antiporter subunit F
MNPWLFCAIFLVLCMAPALAVCARGDPVGRLIALMAANTMATMVLLLLSVAFNHDYLGDLALALAILTLGGGLVFARFLERWF